MAFYRMFSAAGENFECFVSVLRQTEMKRRYWISPFSVHSGVTPAQCLRYNCVLCKLHLLKVCQQVLNYFPLISKSAQFYLAKEGCLLP